MMHKPVARGGASRMLDQPQWSAPLRRSRPNVVILLLVEPDAVDEVIESLRQAAQRGQDAAIGPPPRRHVEPADAERAALTKQEAAVAALASRAMTNQQIANRLGISPHTVNYHLRQIFQKLNIRSRVSLARLAAGQEPLHDADCGSGWDDDARA
jgi:DNA-binding CsgD family transcriptional regulator